MVDSNFIDIPTDLHERAEIRAMAQELGQGVDAVVGSLFRVWCWFARESSSTLPGDASTVDAITRKPGFAEAMARHGLLFIEDGTVRISTDWFQVFPPVEPQQNVAQGA